MKEITYEQLEQFENAFKQNKNNKIAMNASIKNGILKSAENRKDFINMGHNYSINIETGDITNQMKSGRCWMFAALNVMRVEIMKKLNLESFELSQAYPLFWDKLEKSNLFLENIIESLSLPLESREVGFLLKDPLGDGGQWDMFSGIVEKYGVVPKQFMPESFSSSNTRQMTKYLTLKLREFACVLRTANEEGKSEAELRSMKDDMLSIIYRMLCISLGEPPKSFTLEIRDKDKKFIRLSELSPKEFFKEYVSINLNDYVSLINAPTTDKPYFNTYTVQYLGSVVGGAPVKYLNLPIENLKRAAIAQMEAGESVWFGCDVGQSSLMDDGVMSMDIFDVDELFDTQFPLDKAQRLDYSESLMTHAMVLCGVNIDDDGKPNRWRVQNSWGKDRGVDGFYVMSDEWFNEYTYQVVVNKKYLTNEERKMFEKEPIVLKPWDPMGSLAI
ncbi:MAG: C1 family peptidase [Christensenellaceae bacterium]|nr:C1 family peptidase [Christensenellaceae bacterium]